ncbi:MAG TPA: pyridoxamine 5'-phosphate oxidase family protein [Bryobacteraceae bacterium]|jgi:general stress protein 26|nr:pyridoxamine 5'-phosphate oxidase family protein [Bryobacteraceae bacterium]
MDPKSRVYDIVQNFSTAMLVTTGPAGRPEARPMQIAKVEEGGDVWFFTGKSGRVVEETGQDPTVLLVFQDERSTYVSLRGRARVVQDRARVKDLWKEAYQVWFPKGVDDPDLALLAVDPVSAEYWDSRGTNKLEYLFEAAKAYVKGERPRTGDPDKHANVTM